MVYKQRCLTVERRSGLRPWTVRVVPTGSALYRKYRIKLLSTKLCCCISPQRLIFGTCNQWIEPGFGAEHNNHYTEWKRPDTTWKKKALYTEVTWYVNIFSGNFTFIWRWLISFAQKSYVNLITLKSCFIYGPVAYMEKLLSNHN